MDVLPSWSAAGHLALMTGLDRNVATLDLLARGLFWRCRPARALATVVRRRGQPAVACPSGSVGHLASLPLPDIEGSLEEVHPCCDGLGLHGFALLTHVDDVSSGRSGIRSGLRGARPPRLRACSSTPTSPVCWDRTSFGRPLSDAPSSCSTPRGPSSTWRWTSTVARHPTRSSSRTPARWRDTPDDCGPGGRLFPRAPGRRPCGRRDGRLGAPPLRPRGLPGFPGNSTRSWR